MFTSPGSYPHSEAHSVLIKPGRQTTIKLSMLKSISENIKRRPCQEQDVFIEYYNVILGGNHTTKYKTGFSDCKYRKLLKKRWSQSSDCQCIPFMTPVTLDVSQKYPVCLNISQIANESSAIKAKRELDCISQYYNSELGFDDSQCFDEEPCTIMTYSSETLISDWPTETIMMKSVQRALSQVIMSETMYENLPGLKGFMMSLFKSSSDVGNIIKENFALVS
jgi:hypothetical protein